MAKVENRRTRSTTQGSYVNLVYHRTRNAIIRGEYPPGSPLRLQDLATENGVSLIPVREALRLLEAERLVETIPNKGARVSPLALDDVIDAYQTRIVLEVDALGRAYPKLTVGELAAARRLKDEMVRRFKKGDDSAYKIHRDVHFAFYDRSESTWLLHLIHMLWDHTERYRRLATPLHPDYDEVGEEHARIIDAVERRDLRGAKKALREHLQTTVRLLIENLAGGDRVS
jgi:DNA-binding GntR family transcriptional regulator